MSTTPLVLLGKREQADAAELALQQQLQLAFVPARDQDKLGEGFYLRLEGAGLTLYAANERGRGGLRVDFTAPALARRARESLRKHDLGKALGLKSGRMPEVLDGTGGFATDAFLMASHGCRVQLRERSPLVYAMLEDGWRRGVAQDGELARTLQRITLKQGNYGAAAAAAPATPVDVVYLDPMFPVPGKRAASKKAMAYLQEILDADNDEQALLARARQDARRRVVVKRARLSPALAGVEPDLSFRGKSNRYDVYLTGKS